MKKIPVLKILSKIILISGISSVLYAEKTDLECENTWAQSSASRSCGAKFCTYQNLNYFTNARSYYKENPEKIFSSSYNSQTNECTFNTLCIASGTLPGKRATCYETSITVLKDTLIKNEGGYLKPDQS